jgi:hypothetical protein
MNATPILEFANNTAYGAMPNGLSYWWINTANNTPQNGPGSVIKNFVVWNNYQWGLFGYQSQNLTLDGFTNIGNATIMNEGNGGIGLHFADYYENNLTVTNGDFENLAVAVESPVLTDGTPTTIANTTFRSQVDVVVIVPWTVNYSADGYPSKSMVLRNDTFDLSLSGGATAINMQFPNASMLGFETLNLMSLNQVFVYGYNGVAGNNFQVFYGEQSASYVVPPSVISQFSSTAHRVVGSPQAGLTNQQLWATWGVAVAGALAPSTATTMHGIADGLVVPI